MSREDNVVVFDYAAWQQRFPEFASVSEPLAQMYFAEATLLLDNTAASQVTNYDQRAIMLNLLTAHIAWLNGWGRPGSAGGGGGNQGLVGPITSATEGSVTVAVANLAATGDTSAMRAWLSQSQYGAEYWALTTAYRMARYYPGRQPYLGVGPRFIGNGRW